MPAKKYIITGIGILISATAFWFLQKGLGNVSFPATTVTVGMNISNDCYSNNFKLYYSPSETQKPEDLVTFVKGKSTGAYQQILFDIPSNFRPEKIRFDLGDCATRIKIKNITFYTKKDSTVWNAGQLYNAFVPNECVSVFELRDDHLYIESRQNYPAIASKPGVNMDALFFYPDHIKPCWYALLTGLLVFAIWHFIFFDRMGKASVPETRSLRRIIRPTGSYFGLLFMVVLFTSVVFIKPFEDINKVNKEKRSRQKFSRIKVPTILTYTSGLNSFLNDNFGGRNNIIAGYAYVKIKLFGVSPDRNKVEIGPTGRLFYTGEDLIEQSENRYPLTPDQLKKMRKTLVERKEWLKLKGIEYYVMIPHITQNIYEEDLPKSIRKYNNGVTKREQLLQFLMEQSDLQVINLDTIMREGKKHANLYLKHDTHWNFMAGYLAYRKILKEMGKHFDLGKPITSKNMSYSMADLGEGDCQSLMGAPYEHNNTTIVLTPKKTRITQVQDSSETIKALTPKGNHSYFLIDINQRLPEAPKLLIYRDSYVAFFTKYLSNHFSSTTLVWSRFFNPDEVSYAKPNIVLLEMAERMLFNLEMGNPSKMENELKANGIVIDDKWFESHKKAQ